MPDPFITAAVGIPAITNLLGLLMNRKDKTDEDVQKLVADACHQLLKYQEWVATLQATNMELQQSLATHQEKLRELKRRTAREDEFVRGGPLYFRKTPDGSGLEDGVYCRDCLENQQILRTLGEAASGGSICWHCNERDRNTVVYPREDVERHRESALQQLAPRE